MRGDPEVPLPCLHGRVDRLSSPPPVDELAGPEHGVVQLPLRLMWNPNRRFDLDDLDDPDELLWMYENVLREAIRLGEIRRWINAAILRRVWPDLNLPRGVRQAWEARHPGLRPAAWPRA